VAVTGSIEPNIPVEGCGLQFDSARSWVAVGGKKASGTSGLNRESIAVFR